MYNRVVPNYPAFFVFIFPEAFKIYWEFLTSDPPNYLLNSHSFQKRCWSRKSEHFYCLKKWWLMTDTKKITYHCNINAFIAPLRIEKVAKLKYRFLRFFFFLEIPFYWTIIINKPPIQTSHLMHQFLWRKLRMWSRTIYTADFHSSNII